eukprot:6180717-Pleurochrysis_carterae.AAC.4
MFAGKIKVSPATRRATRLANEQHAQQDFSNSGVKPARERVRLRRLRHVGQRLESVMRSRQQCDAIGDASFDTVSRSVCGLQSE